MIVDLLKSLPRILPVSEADQRPLWSVMIPCFNNSSYLKKTIESVLVQYPGPDKMQIMVVDDYSTSGEAEKIVTETGQGKVDFFRQPENVGHSKNYDTCIRKAKGKLIHILHQDDYVRPGFYEQMSKLFTEFPGIGAAFCRHIFIDEKDNWISISEIEKEENGILDNWLLKIAERQRIQYSSMVVKRSTYEHLGGFINKDIAEDGWQMAGEDWEMWVRIAAHYDIGYLTQPLAEYRIHKSSMTSNLSRTGSNIRDLQKIIDTISRYIPDDKKELVKISGEKHFAGYAFNVAKTLLDDTNNKEAAGAQLNEAIRMYPDIIEKNLSVYLELNKLIEHKGVSVIFSGEDGAGSAETLIKYFRKQIRNLNFPVELIYADISSEKSKIESVRNELSRINAENYSFKILSQHLSNSQDAMRRGIEESAYDYVLFYTPDISLDDDFISKGYSILNDKKEIGILGGKFNLTSDKELPAWLNRDLLYKTYGILPEINGSGDISYSNDSISIKGAFLRKKAWEEITENGFIPLLADIKQTESRYGPDTELCNALRNAGWKIWYEPEMKLTKHLLKQKLCWNNLRRKWREFGENSYSKKKTGKAYRFELRHLIKKIRTAGKRKLTEFKRPNEGDIKVIHAEYNFGKINSLLKERTENHKKRIRLLRKAARKSDHGYLRLLYKNFNKKPATKGVSVIICCHNSANLLPETLRHISLQKVRRYVRWEVIVVDSSSTDNTAEAAIQEWSRYKNCKGTLRVVKQSIPGLSAAREKGIEESKFEYMIFCDDDNRLDKRYIQTAVSAMRIDKEIGVIGGETEEVCEVTPPDWFENWKSLNYEVGEQSDKAGDITRSRGFVWGAGMVLRRSALDQLFRENLQSTLTSGEEKEIVLGDKELCNALRNAGWKIWYEPALKLKQYLSAQKLSWDYLRTMWRESGANSYSNKKPGRAHRFELRKLTGKIRTTGRRKLTEFRELEQNEGDTKIIHAEYYFGKLNSLLKKKTQNPKQRIKLLRKTARKSDRGYLKLLYDNFYRKTAAKGVSVIICCYNSSKLLPETLRHISLQKVRNYVRWEVIVVDNASTDNTAEVALQEWSRYKDCKGTLSVVKQPIPGLAAAREKGIEESKYEYMIFCDDDNWLEEKFIQTVVSTMRTDNEIGIIGCETEEVCEINPPEWFEKWKNWSYAVGVQTDKTGDITWSRGFVWGAGMVLRRKALNQLYGEGFKTLLTDRKGKELASGGDTELCYALRLAGWRIWYEPRLKLKHYMTAPRLKWEYLLKLWKGFGISTVGLDTYLNIIPANMIEGNYVEIKKTWAENVKDTLNKLKSSGLKKVLFRKDLPEGDPDLPLIVHNLARLKELFKLRKQYTERTQGLKRSDWKRDFYHLQLKSIKYKKKEIENKKVWPWVNDSDDKGENDIQVNEKLKISVLTPSFNSEFKIEKAIQSVLKQNYENFEHIIVDGGSKDNTVNILKKYPHLIWTSGPDQGQCDAMNKAFEMCTGDIICYLNSDDYFHPLAFKKVIRAFQENENADMIVGNLILDMEEINMVIYPEVDYKKIMRPFSYSFPINPVSYFYKRKVQEETGKFPLDNHYTMDYWFLLKVYQKFKLKKIEETLGTFYFHESNKTGSADNARNTHITVMKHLRQTDTKNIPYYLYFYYKNKFFGKKGYSSDKSSLRHLKADNLKRFTFTKEFSDYLYDKAYEKTYNYNHVKGLILLGISAIAYPPKVFHESRRSLLYRSLFGHNLVEKSRKLYYAGIVKKYELRESLRKKYYELIPHNETAYNSSDADGDGTFSVYFGRNSMYHSNEAFLRSKDECYNYHYLKGFLYYTKSLAINPFTILNESRRSLLIRLALGHKLTEKLRDTYYQSQIKKYEISSKISNKYSGMSLFARVKEFFRNIYFYFRYRKYKAKSKLLYAQAIENYNNKKRLDTILSLIPSYLLYPVSIFNRNKMSLMINSLLGGSVKKKIKTPVKK